MRVTSLAELPPFYGLQKGEDMPEEVKEIIEELEKAVEPNDFGQGVVFAIQTIKGKYGIDDWEQDNERIGIEK